MILHPSTYYTNIYSSTVVNRSKHTCNKVRIQIVKYKGKLF